MPGQPECRLVVIIGRFSQPESTSVDIARTRKTVGGGPRVHAEEKVEENRGNRLQIPEKVMENYSDRYLGTLKNDLSVVNSK